ncbi:MAG TPA: sialidase family protein [Arthrobacter sp.]
MDPDRNVLHSEGGAFDLPSILVGVVVVGVLTTGVLGSVFGVIPFTQDSGAKQDLASLSTAEGVAKAKDSRFASSSVLKASGYLPASASKLAADTDAAGSCFVGVSKSGAGTVYASSNAVTTPFALTSTTLTGCITRPQLKDLVTAAGGFSDGSVVNTGPVFGSVTWKTGTYSGPDGLDRVAVSADAKKIIGTDLGRNLYVSSDSGATLTAQASLGTSWNAVSASPDGTHLAAVTYGSANILASSSDGGATWSTSGGIPGSEGRTWTTLAMSADGTKLFAGTNGEYAYMSSDSGATWTKQTALGTHWFNSPVLSSDGARISFVADNKLFTSTDSGSTWSQKALPAYIGHLTQSADGTKMVATRYDGADNFIWTSSDSGTSWTSRPTLGTNDISAIASSSDGSRLVAVTGTQVFTSGDAGATWTLQSGLPTNAVWTSAASSADGATLFLSNNLSAVFTGTWGP